MKKYAIHNNQIVLNIIISESEKDVQDNIDYPYVEIIDDRPQIGWINLSNFGWVPPSPYQSWIWNGETWIAPIPIPENLKFPNWNEELQQWEEQEIPPPFPSWIKNEEGYWVAPLPYPDQELIYSWNEELQQWEEQN